MKKETGFYKFLNGTVVEFHGSLEDFMYALYSKKNVTKHSEEKFSHVCKRTSEQDVKVALTIPGTKIVVPANS